MKYYLIKYKGELYKTTSLKVLGEAINRGGADIGYISGWNITTNIPNVIDMMRLENDKT